jgi:hypothetical protein
VGHFLVHQPIVTPYVTNTVGNRLPADIPFTGGDGILTLRPTESLHLIHRFSAHTLHLLLLLNAVRPVASGGSHAGMAQPSGKKLIASYLNSVLYAQEDVINPQIGAEKAPLPPA